MVAFDLDGVLVDSERAIRWAYEQAGATMPVDAFGSPASSWRPSERVRQLKAAAYPEALRRYGERLPAADVARRRLDRGRDVWVVTYASAAGASAALDFVGLPDANLVCVRWRGLKHNALAEIATRGVYVDDDPTCEVPGGWRLCVVERRQSVR